MMTRTRLPKRLALSVIVPVYNEEACLELLYDKIRSACDQLNNPYEIIFVDDGSKDRTPVLLERLHGRDRRVVVIRFRKNYGQTAAMSAGFRAARGEVIVSMDGDLQNDPGDIPGLLARLREGYDVVCGWRKDRKDKWLSRRVPSIIANWLIGKITGVPIHDNGCSLKAYRASVIKRVALYSEMHRFIPAMSTLAGARITEIVVRHHPRRFGTSKYGISRAWKVLSDLCLIKMLTACAARPALWFGMLSVPAFMAGTVCMLAMLMPEVTGVVLPSSAFLFFAMAGHLIAMGVFGEMVLHAGDYRPEKMLKGMEIRRVWGRAQGSDLLGGE